MEFGQLSSWEKTLMYWRGGETSFCFSISLFSVARVIYIYFFCDWAYRDLASVEVFTRPGLDLWEFHPLFGLLRREGGHLARLCTPASSATTDRASSCQSNGQFKTLSFSFGTLSGLSFSTCGDSLHVKHYFSLSKPYLGQQKGVRNLRIKIKQNIKT